MLPFLEPPTSSLLRKRKRSSPVADSPVARLPREAINPHSHRPSLWKQLTVAGLTYDDRLPQDYVDDFPHRPLPESDASEASEESESEDDALDSADEAPVGANREDTLLGYSDDEDDKEENDSDGSDSPHTHRQKRTRAARQRAAKRRTATLQTLQAYDRQAGVLIAAVQRGLQEADHGMAAVGSEAGRIGLARARRAFGLLLRTKVAGRRVDLRRHYLWALGAEVLMRAGEDEREHGPDEDEDTAAAGGQPQRRRWGTAGNLGHVRIYYEDLIQQYPYNRHRPRATSALTFWPALVSTEVYSIYTEERLASQRLDEEEGGDEDDMDYDEMGDQTVDSSMDVDSGRKGGESEEEEETDEEGGRPAAGDRLQTAAEMAAARQKRLRFQRRRANPLRAKRERLRAQTLEQVQDLARRMDITMESMPFSSSPEMLRLRGMVALYAGDLAMATEPRTRREAVEGRRLRAQERERARTQFARLVAETNSAGGANTTGNKSGRGGATDVVVDAFVVEMAKTAEEKRQQQQQRQQQKKKTRQTPKRAGRMNQTSYETEYSDSTDAIKTERDSDVDDDYNFGDDDNNDDDDDNRHSMGRPVFTSNGTRLRG